MPVIKEVCNATLIKFVIHIIVPIVENIKGVMFVAITIHASIIIRRLKLLPFFLSLLYATENLYATIAIIQMHIDANVKCVKFSPGKSLHVTDLPSSVVIPIFQGNVLIMSKIN